MRMKAHNFEVKDPDKAMERFKSLLGNLVKVPKSEIRAKPKPAKARPKPKQKA